MEFPDPELKAYVFQTAPPMHPAWLEYEKELEKRGPPPTYESVLQRQPIYAQECREIHSRLMAPGARDHALSQGVEKREFTIPSSLDGTAIPILQLDLAENQSQDPEVVIIYYHGGGLVIGEADSEEHSCRHLMKSGVERVRLYSVGYRLMPTWAASVCLSDSMDGFNALRSKTGKTIIVGSSSGGQMASAVSQAAPIGTVHGVLLRCPVTADRPSGIEYIPERLQPYHTSATPSFVNSLLGYLLRDVPRDGLERLPLEATRQEIQHLPRTWIQLATNDTLYSDGLCYAMILRDAGVEVQIALEKGWPHTFWLKAHEMPQSLEAEKRMIDGLKWILE
ncbi:Alpha/Beta hydrolase protein [Mariannaea sp. PMI_226]|nr:Alpha/Beta hydrolase protein [Mariannaea sp. PMI_226]